MAKEETNALEREEQAPPLRTQSEPEKEICCREDKPNSLINQNLKVKYFFRNMISNMKGENYGYMEAAGEAGGIYAQA